MWWLTASLALAEPPGGGPPPNPTRWTSVSDGRGGNEPALSLEGVSGRWVEVTASLGALSTTWSLRPRLTYEDVSTIDEWITTHLYRRGDDMDFIQAKRAIVGHGADGADEPGFIRMFRPFRGLREEAFHELVAAIRVAAPALRLDTNLDPELVGSLWSILVYTYAYVLAPDSSLQQNHSISAADIATVHGWYRTIGFVVSGIQAGGDVKHVFESYDQEFQRIKH